MITSDEAGGSFDVEEYLDVGVILIDGGMSVVRWNRWVERCSGIRAEVAIGRNFFEIMPQVYGSRLGQAIRGALAAPTVRVVGDISDSFLFSGKKATGGTGRRSEPHRQNIRVLPLKKGGRSMCLLQVSRMPCRRNICPSETEGTQWRRQLRVASHRFFAPGRLEDAASRVASECDLRNALARREFRMVFQPVVTPEGQIAGFEGLLRWNRKGFSISPKHFIATAERIGLIRDVGRAGLGLGLSALRHWVLTHNYSGFLAVNVSPLQFGEPDFEDEFLRSIELFGLPPTQIVVELTESAVMQDIDRAAAQMSRLKRMGLRFALDDFGTGYASLSQLAKLPVDILKLDSSFIRGVELPRVRMLFYGVSNLAQQLGYQVIVEGVETEEHLKFVTQASDFFGLQGFYLSRPLESPEATEWVARERAKRLLSSF